MEQLWKVINKQDEREYIPTWIDAGHVPCSVCGGGHRSLLQWVGPGEPPRVGTQVTPMYLRRSPTCSSLHCQDIATGALEAHYNAMYSEGTIPPTRR